MIFKTKVSTIVLHTILLTSIFYSCSKNSEKIINDSKFDLILSELIVIENMAVSDSLKAHLMQKKISESDISISEIQSHISSHQQNPEYWKDAYNRIKEIIKKE